MHHCPSLAATRLLFSIVAALAVCGVVRSQRLGSPNVLSTLPVDGGIAWNDTFTYEVEGLLFHISTMNSSSSDNFLVANLVLMQVFNHSTATPVYEREFACYSIYSTARALYRHGHQVLGLNATHAAFFCNGFSEGYYYPWARVYIFDPLTGVDHWVAEKKINNEEYVTIDMTGILNRERHQMLLAPAEGTLAATYYLVDLQHRAMYVAGVQNSALASQELHVEALDGVGNMGSVVTYQSSHLTGAATYQLQGIVPYKHSIDTEINVIWSTNLPPALDTVVSMSSWVWPPLSTSPTTTQQFVLVLAASGTTIQLKGYPYTSVRLSNFTLLVVNTESGSIAATVPLPSIPDGMIMLDPSSTMSIAAHFHYPVVSSSGGMSITVLHLSDMLHLEEGSKANLRHICGSVAIEIGGAPSARELWSKMVVGECDWHPQQEASLGWFVAQPTFNTTSHAPTVESVNVVTGSTNCSVSGIPQLREGTSDISSFKYSVAHTDNFTTVALGDLLLLQGHDNGVPRRFVGIKECSAQFTFDAGGVVDLEQVTRFGDTLVVPTQLSATKGHLAFVNASDIIPPPVADRADDGDGHRRIYIIVGIVAGATVVVVAVVGLIVRFSKGKRSDSGEGGALVPLNDAGSSDGPSAVPSDE